MSIGEWCGTLLLTWISVNKNCWLQFHCPTLDNQGSKKFRCDLQKFLGVDLRCDHLISPARFELFSRVNYSIWPNSDPACGDKENEEEASRRSCC
jgi:hypothetical protein